MIIIGDLLHNIGVDLEGRQMSRIPTDEEFALAKRLMKERYRGLEQVSEHLKSYFIGRSPIHNVYVFCEGVAKFRVYIFFKADKDVLICKNNGTIQEMTDFIYKELDQAGRGSRNEVKVEFEFDSDENVTANYEGNYFLRLR